MNPSLNTIILTLISISIPFRVEADTSPASPNYPSPEYASLKPSLAVVIGILTIMFVLTFLLVAYAKFCHRPTEPQQVTNPNPDAILSSSNNNRFSGIDKTVIESLPFFRFSSLKGSKQGLECSVCLSRFEDVEVLRLLPKCKHAFHIDCIDRWLEKHSSCPLCRHRVSSDDLKLVSYSDYSNSIRQDSLFVQREDSHNHRVSSRFSFRKIAVRLVDTDEESNNLIFENQVFHKHNHKILVSEFVFKNRWSNVTSSDLIHLNSEMMRERLVLSEETKKKMKDFEDKVGTISGINDNKASLNSGEQRSVSEITSFSRYGHLSEHNNNGNDEERVRRVWLPIARRTVQWFVNREDRSQVIDQQQTLRQSLHV